MLLNFTEINGATTLSWRTGDVNGPTVVWSQQPAPSPVTWSKETV